MWIPLLCKWWAIELNTWFIHICLRMNDSPYSFVTHDKSDTSVKMNRNYRAISWFSVAYTSTTIVYQDQFQQKETIFFNVGLLKWIIILLILPISNWYLQCSVLYKAEYCTISGNWVISIRKKIRYWPYTPCFYFITPKKQERLRLAPYLADRSVVTPQTCQAHWINKL